MEDCSGTSVFLAFSATIVRTTAMAEVLIVRSSGVHGLDTVGSLRWIGGVCVKKISNDQLKF